MEVCFHTLGVPLWGLYNKGNVLGSRCFGKLLYASGIRDEGLGLLLRDSGFSGSRVRVGVYGRVFLKILGP